MCKPIYERTKTVNRKLFLFDLDGTVGNTLESIAYTAELAFKDFGIVPQKTEKFRYFAGDGADVMIQRALASSNVFDPEMIQKVTVRYREYFVTGCTYHVGSFPGLKQTLEELKKQGALIAVCSNKDQVYAEKVVGTIYGKNFFDRILGKSALLPGKPDPAMPLSIAADLKVSFEDCIYVGDTNTDMKCGKSAGMYTVGVLWGFRDKEELVSSGADLIIDEPALLLKLLA